MDLIRYNTLKERIINNYLKLRFSSHRCYVAPSVMMTTEELRSREHFQFGDTVSDEHYYRDKQSRSLTVVMILGFKENLASKDDLRFQTPNTTIVDIYETIQTYIADWCEIVRETPDIPAPPLSELSMLEDLAYYLFDEYKVIKPYQDYLRSKKQTERYTEVDDATREGLVGLSILLGKDSLFNSKFRTESDEFVSHINSLKAMYTSALEQYETPMTNLNGLVDHSGFGSHVVQIEDSIIEDEAPEVNSLAEWYKGGS